MPHCLPHSWTDLTNSFVDECYNAGVRQMTTERPNYSQVVAQFQLRLLKMECPLFQNETRDYLGGRIIKEFKNKTNGKVVSPYRKKLTEICGK